MWQIKQADEDDIEAIVKIIKQTAPIAFFDVGTQDQLDKWIDYHTQPQIILENLKAT